MREGVEMKSRLLVIFITSFFISGLQITHASAAAKVFKNCTELNKIYPGGVAMPGAANKGGSTRFEPKISKALYLANKKSDRDNDGIACEK